MMPRFRRTRFAGDPERQAESDLAREERKVEAYSEETLAMECDQYGYPRYHVVRGGKPTKGAREFDAATPFEFNRLYGNEKYSLNNMLLTEYNFPREYFPNQDELDCTWSDRVSFEWGIASRLLKSNAVADAYFSGVDGESLIAFANKLFDLISWREFRDRYKFHLERMRSASGGAQISDDAAGWAAAEEAPQTHHYTGAAVVRFTNAGGYPVLRLTVIKPCDKKRRMGHPLREAPYRDPWTRFGQY